MNEVLILLVPIAILLFAIKLSLRIFLSRGAEEEMVGTLAADVVRFMFKLPFRFLRWFARIVGLIP